MYPRKIAILKPAARAASTFITACLLNAINPAFAQTAPDAGQVLREAQPRPVPALPQTAPELRIEERPEKTIPVAARFTVKSVRITGNRLFPESTLLPLADGVIGADRSLADLEAAARRISAFYRAQGVAVARAYVPAQDIRNGAITIAVLEGELGKKSIVSRSGAVSPAAQALLDRLPAGQPVDTAQTNRTMLLLGELPGIGKVDGNLKPGDRVGSSDLFVTIEPGKAVEGAVSVDNYGNRFTGANRLNGQLLINNPFDLADRISLRATVSDARLLSGRAAWDAAVGHDGLRVGVSASASRYELSQEFAALQAHGTARTAAVYASYPIVLQGRQHVRLGSSIEKRWISDQVDSVGSSTSKHAHVWVTDLSGDLLDDLVGGGFTTWRLSPSLGRLMIDSAAALATDQASAQTAGGYLKWTAGVTREQRLPLEGMSIYGSLNGQAASRNLDSSEKFVLGGIYGVRAYPQGEAAGDEGLLANFELRKLLMSGWQGAVFYDAGSVKVNRKPYIVGSNNRHISGYGLGLTYSKESFSLSASLAWRGGSSAPTSDRDKRARFWLQAGWRF